MPVVCREENRCLTAAVSGELDHHRAREVMEELDPVSYTHLWTALSGLNAVCWMVSWLRAAKTHPRRPEQDRGMG